MTSRLPAKGGISEWGLHAYMSTACDVIAWEGILEAVLNSRETRGPSNKKPCCSKSPPDGVEVGDLQGSDGKANLVVADISGHLQAWTPPRCKCPQVSQAPSLMLSLYA